MSNTAGWDFRVSDSQLAEITAMLKGIKNGVPRAVVRALNQTAKTTRTQAVKGAREQYRLSSAFLKERIWGPNESPGNKATFTRMRSKVTAQRRGLRLAHFMTDEGLRVGGVEVRPIKVQVFRRGGQKSLTPNRLASSAFLLRLKNTGKVGIFVRTGERKVEHLYGPSPSQIFQRQLPDLSQAMSAYLVDQVDKEAQAVLRQYG